LLLFTFAAYLDPFLNLWDERFHALVAKNILENPWKPMLYIDPVIPMEYFPWDRMHVWIHKPPLFLWQIGLSFHLFGISEFTLRLPSVLLSVVFVWVAYRTGKLLVNRTSGYLAGVLFLSTPYMLELVAGRQELEHNDLAFMVYVSLSIWAWIEYHFSGKKKWIFFIGLFSGMAILTKWLPGMLVYLGWITVKAQNRSFSLKENKDLFTALAITITVALPWQVYTLIRFPEEALYALSMNTSHFMTALEGHRGNFWYHFNQVGIIYGPLAPFLVVPSFYLLHKKMEDKSLFFALLVMVLFVYLFFSLAKTKMPSFTLIVALMVMISFGTLLDLAYQWISKWIKRQWIASMVFILFILGLIIIRFDVETFQENHTTWKESNQYTRMMIHNKALFQSLELPENAVLLNVKGRHYIEAMFYTGLPAYPFIPDQEQYRVIKENGKVAALFVIPGQELPEYILKDPSNILIDKMLQGYE
jgi:4-amino-4-deoxy-L-arabinose transferase